MILPDAAWRHWPGLERLMAALGADERETRFVGGCIRDALLGLDVSDVDLATRLAPDAVMERLKRNRIKAVPTGLAHGTVTAIIQGRPIEVTTLRRDVATDGRRATIAYTDDWREDAARRDFTINALSAEPVSGAIHDYFDGLTDIKERRVRFIGDPLTRIAEDHLRILRFFRFHTRFGEGEPDAAGLEACAGRANDLMALSRERIADELLKLLALPDPAPTVALMIERGIFRPVLPEVDGADTLERLIAREDVAGVPADGLRRLAALLPADEEIALDVGARLRLSNRARLRLGCIARRSDSDGKDAFRLAYEVGRDCAVDRILLNPALGDEQAVAAIDSLEGWIRPKLGISGGSLIAMGLSAGPIVAATMQAIEREWVERGFPSDRETVRALARRHVDQALRSSQ